MILDAGRQQYTLHAQPRATVVRRRPSCRTSRRPKPRACCSKNASRCSASCAARIDGLFDTFLKLRGSSGWEGHVNGVRRWIMQPVKTAAA